MPDALKNLIRRHDEKRRLRARRRLQFSSRSMLLIVTILCVSCASMTYWAASVMRSFDDRVDEYSALLPTSPVGDLLPGLIFVSVLLSGLPTFGLIVTLKVQPRFVMLAILTSVCLLVLVSGLNSRIFETEIRKLHWPQWLYVMLLINAGTTLIACIAGWCFTVLLEESGGR